MDTISIKLTINYNKGVTADKLSDIRNKIDALTSPYGYTYCDVQEVNLQNGIIVMKISYPRFFYGNNSYLIKDSKLCKYVNDFFCNSIKYENFFYEIIEIDLIRVDIPFTYMMNEYHEFWHYENIYRVFAIVYTQKNKNSNPKMISTILDKRVETLNYTDTKVSGNYNSKIMIYDQYKNLESKLNDDFQLNRTLEQFPDLNCRMRLEVSKRISRKPFTLDGFSKYDIHGEYYPKFKKYLLTNLLDFDIIENIYNYSASLLAEELKLKRGQNDFKYEVFILNNIHNIFDFEVIKRALKMAIENVKTREGATLTVRRRLEELQANNNIIVMDTYEYLIDIKNQIERDLC